MKQKIRFRMRYPWSTFDPDTYRIAPENHCDYPGFTWWTEVTGMRNWPIVGRRVSQ